MTGEEQEVWLDLDEESATVGTQIVPDPLEEKTMVATSAEVCTCCFHVHLYCAFTYCKTLIMLSGLHQILI